MSSPIIPVLSTDINKLSKPTDIIKYVLRHYVSMPKNINDTFNKQEISFRWDDANVGNSSEAIKPAVIQSLQSVLSRYFPTASSIDVTVETEHIDEVRYDLIIDIMVFIDGASYSISQNFKVDTDGNLTYEFEGS